MLLHGDGSEVRGGESMTEPTIKQILHTADGIKDKAALVPEDELEARIAAARASTWQQAVEAAAQYVESQREGGKMDNVVQVYEVLATHIRALQPPAAQGEG